ncbi:MAG: alpha-L-fucosidase [Planctomycetota bacterium]|jgi:hypothetical protein
MEPLAWFFDFHSTKNIRINHDPDIPHMIDVFKKNDVKEIFTFTKCHVGFAYYPTKFGTPHPQMKGDAFGDVCNACKDAGIEVTAYYSFGIDGEAVRAHGDWCKMMPDGAHIWEDWYGYPCPYTPYTDELMLPMLDEIVTGYPIDGIFFDTMGALSTCYCDYCKKAFKESSGLEIPREDSDPGQKEYALFKYDRGIKLLNDVGAFLQERKSDIRVGFNQVGTPRYPERLPEKVNYLTLDFSTFCHQSFQGSLCSAYSSTTGYHADIMNTTFNQGWGDWTPRPAASLEQFGVSAWIRNCRPHFGDRLRPENRLDRITERSIGLMADLRDRLLKEFPTAEDKASLSPDILTLVSKYTSYGENMENFGDGGPGNKNIEGFHRLHLDAGANFTITTDDYLAENIGKSKLLVMPEVTKIDAEIETSIKDYVESGGKVLFVGSIPHVEGKTLDWLGVERESDPWQDHIYASTWEKEDNDGIDTVLIRGDFHKVKTTGAEVVMEAIKPYDCIYGLKFGWGIGPASFEKSGNPLLTKCKVGKGEVWFLEGNLFSDYEENANWTQISWYRHLLAKIITKPDLRIISEAGTIEGVMHANEKSSWTFILNHGGEQYSGNPGDCKKWTRTFEPLPAFPIRVEFAAKNDKPKSVTCMGNPIDYKIEDGNVVINMKLDAVWKAIRIDW